MVDDQDYAHPLLARGEAMGRVSTSSDPPTGFLADPKGAIEYECVANGEFARTFFRKVGPIRDLVGGAYHEL